MPASAMMATWELGQRLRELRDHLDLSIGATARAVKMQQPNLSAIEAGKKKITAASLAQLAELYEIEPDEREELEALRVRAYQRDWYHQYTLLGEDNLRYVGLEAGAERLRTYTCSLVPGLFQTTDYTTALIKAASPWIRLTELEPRIEARRARQRRLSGDDPLHVFALLSEAVLRQEVGGRDVQRGQLEHLVQLATDRDNVEIRVIPFRAGAHAALGGPFEILSFRSRWLPDVVWLETLTALSFIERPELVREFVVVLAEASDKALDSTASVDLIREIREELR